MNFSSSGWPNRLSKFFKILFIVLLILEFELRAIGASYYFFQTRNFFKNTKGRIKILCLGESTTFGWGVKKGEDYPSQLNKLLELKYPKRFIVYNRGLPGAISIKILRELERFSVSINPKFVIILCGANDYNPGLRAAQLKYMASNHRGFSFFFFNILNDLKIYKVALAAVDLVRYEARLAYVSPDKKDLRQEFSQAEIKFITKQYLSNLDDMVKVAREAGAEVVFSTYFFPSLNYLEIKDAARKNGAALSNQVEALKISGFKESEILCSDGFHPSPLGHRLIAETLLKTLESMPEFREALRSKNTAF